MFYAMRKLTAFMSLGGLFMFIYHDMGNLNHPWFIYVLGMIFVSFAFFRMLVSVVVVRFGGCHGFSEWDFRHIGFRRSFIADIERRGSAK